MSVIPIPSRSWASVEDLARWLLTRSNEYEFAMVCLMRKNRKAGDPVPENNIDTFCCPSVPVIQAVGLLEVCKQIYIDESRG